MGDNVRHLRSLDDFAANIMDHWLPIDNTAMVGMLWKDADLFDYVMNIDVSDILADSGNSTVGAALNFALSFAFMDAWEDVKSDVRADIQQYKSTGEW
jgi:hypothetical protein